MPLLEFKSAAHERLGREHAELEANTNQILDSYHTLQSQRVGFDKNSPSYNDDIAANDASLKQAQQALTDLYHPAKNPGALQKLGGFVQQHILRRQAPAKTPGEVKKSFADTMTEINKGITPSSDANPLLVKKRQMKEAGFTDEQIQQALGVSAGIQAKAVPEKTKYQPQLTTTKDAAGKDHYWRVPLEEGGKPEEVDFSGQAIQPKVTAGSTPKVGSFGDFMIQAYGPKPTAKQYEQGRQAWAKSNAGTTVGEHVILVPQLDGSVKAITVQTTSQKEFGTPAQVKQKAAAVAPKAHAGVLGEGMTVGGRMTPPQNKAQSDYDESVKLSSIADQVALKPDDAINQKRLAVALERTSAGRFTTQALDYIIKAGWGNTMEQWYNNPSTGALPADVMRQLIDGAHQNQTAAKAALDTAMGKQGIPAGGDAMISVQIPGQLPGKIHASQKTAFMKKYPNATVQ